MNTYIREPINALTHLIGAILSVFALIAMIIKVTTLDNPTIIGLSAIITFGISMILLYSTSATYHMVISSDKVLKFLQRLDHSMIFVLIAGTYTPFCLIALDGKSGWILFSIITLIAICGIVFKLAWFNCPRILSTSIYIIMGWMAIFVFKPLFISLSIEGLILLIGGGILYTIGGVIYALKPKCLYFKHLGFHEIFHIFIMLGSLCHFLCIYLYVI